MFDTEITNRTRAEWAREGLSAFEPCVYLGDPDDVECLSTRIRDLITNLLHLARLEWNEEMAEDQNMPEFDAEKFVLKCALMHDIEMNEDDDDD